MSAYTINNLRADIAGTIKALREGDKNMDVQKAKTIGELAQTMINSAKVEVDAMRALGHGLRRPQPTGFFALEHKDTLDHQEGKQPTGADVPKPDPDAYIPAGSGPRGSL